MRAHCLAILGSALAVLTVSPIRRHVGLYARFQQDNFKAVHVAAFLRQLLRHLPGRVLLVWDQGQIHKINDGTEVIIRPLTREDYDKSLRFFIELPEEDRLHLRVDVRDPEVVRRRLDCEEYQNVFRIVAEFGDRIVGDGMLEWPKFGWMAHVGELRAITSKDFRRRGLATLLFRQLFIYGVRQGLEKFEARMMADQVSIRRCVERLGFTEEGILACCTGNSSDLPAGSSLAMVHFPWDEDAAIDTPQAVHDPTVCDVVLRSQVLGPAMLLEDVHMVQGHGSAATSHSDEDMEILKEACRRVARRVKPHLKSGSG